MADRKFFIFYLLIQSSQIPLERMQPLLMCLLAAQAMAVCNRTCNISMTCIQPGICRVYLQGISAAVRVTGGQKLVCKHLLFHVLYEAAASDNPALTLTSASLSRSTRRSWSCSFCSLCLCGLELATCHNPICQPLAGSR